ncbi:Rrf2 family transcriptional regulator [Undibacter mobilis]|uniref:Rrf2 family transcriptional regulator n=1 Tax=Undibacter mobilis TaxID=2292256 RepID=A0A371BCK7_9BRAD|nr:Rrf2 family transcriptional regulator [Undibacter mobilis]RDV05247.1 Rrf2 family transcriptional regulator [Undibacter mobilis]
MKRDSRLSGVLHILLHMARQSEPLTSEALARAMATNPAVVRRTMAGLRDARLVHSEKGHGGGWTIARDPARITLHDIYLALGKPDVLAMSNRNDAPGCLVEQAVNEALGSAFAEAEALLLRRFSEVTLAQLSASFDRRFAERGADFALETIHAE